MQVIVNEQSFPTKSAAYERAREIKRKYERRLGVPIRGFERDFLVDWVSQFYDERWKKAGIKEIYVDGHPDAYNQKVLYFKDLEDKAHVVGLRPSYSGPRQYKAFRAALPCPISTSCEECRRPGRTKHWLISPTIRELVDSFLAAEDMSLEDVELDGRRLRATLKDIYLEDRFLSYAAEHAVMRDLCDKCGRKHQQSTPAGPPALITEE